MRIFGILLGVAIAFVAVTLCLMVVLPFGAVELIFATSIVAACVNRLVLGRVAPHWSNHRAIVIAALTLPLLVWLIALGFDLSIVLDRHLHPEKSLMGGFTIVLLGPCAWGVLWGLAAAFAVTKLGKLGPRR